MQEGKNIEGATLVHKDIPSERRTVVVESCREYECGMIVTKTYKEDNKSGNVVRMHRVFGLRAGRDEVEGRRGACEASISRKDKIHEVGRGGPRQDS